MYQRVGNAIQAIDPNPLIICEGLIDYPSGAYAGDLRAAAAYPVVLNTPNKVVLSVHEYPNTVGGYGAGLDTGSIYISRMQTMWGFMLSNPAPANACPLWIGECGDYCTNASEQNWASTFVSFCNGTASGGPTFTSPNQGVGTDWWDWAVDEGAYTNSEGTQSDFGCLTAWGTGGTLRAPQAVYINQLSAK
jgi:endoglucanase